MLQIFRYQHALDLDIAELMNRPHNQCSRTLRSVVSCIAIVVTATAVLWGNQKDTLRFNQFASDTWITDRLVTNDSILLVSDSQNGVYVGYNPDSLLPLLTAEQLSLVGRDTQYKLSSDGMIVCAGRGIADEDISLLVWDNVGSEARLYEAKDIPGIRSGGLFRDFELDVFSTGAVHLLNAFSLDSGRTWRVAAYPSGVLGWTNVFHHPTMGFYAYHANSKKWYVLDWDTITWLDMSIYPNVAELTILNNGRMVGVVNEYDLRSGIVYRDVADKEWTRIDSINKTDGSVWKPGKFLDVGAMATVSDSLAIIPLDKGVVAIIGRNVVNALPLAAMFHEAELAGRTIRHISANGSHAAILYRKGLIVELDFSRDNGITVNYYHTSFDDIEEIDYIGPMLIGQNISPTKMLYKLNKEIGEWCLTGIVSVTTASGAQAVQFHGIVASENKVVVTTTNGSIAELDAVNNLIAQNGFLAPRPTSKSNELNMILGSRRTPVLGSSIFSIGDFACLLDNDSSNVMYGSTCTSAAMMEDGALLLGYKQLVRSTDYGAAWDTISVSSQSSDSHRVIGTIATFGSTIVLGSKGYQRNVDGTVIDTIVGGIHVSEDNGITWTQASIPEGADWIENIVASKDSRWYAWASEMTLSGLEGTGALRDFYRSNAYLIESSDQGKTWSVAVDANTSYSSAKSNCWNMQVVDDAGRIITNSTDSVYLLDPTTLTWSAIQTLNIQQPIVGAATRNQNELIVATPHDIVIVPLPTTGVVTKDSYHDPIELSVACNPNPVEDMLTIHISTINGEMDNVVEASIIDVTGSVLVDLSNIFHNKLDHVNKSVIVNTTSLPIGVAYLIVVTERGRYCWPIYKVGS